MLNNNNSKNYGNPNSPYLTTPQKQPHYQSHN